jgi:hypothetical protein
VRIHLHGKDCACALRSRQVTLIVTCPPVGAIMKHHTP